MPVDQSTRTAMADAFQAFCPMPDRLIVPPGYRDSGFALIDSIFSMQARYEGARRVVANYARHVEKPTTPGLPLHDAVPDEHSVADLHDKLTGFTPYEAATQVFRNRAKSARADRLKAELVIEAAERLTAEGLRTRTDVAPLPTHERYGIQKGAWTGIHGLGPVTFEYFRMLCGAETSKPDMMVLGWLGKTLDHRYTWQEALQLVGALAEELESRWNTSVLQRAVDHTIWRHQSGRGLDVDAPIGWNAEVDARGLM